MTDTGRGLLNQLVQRRVDVDLCLGVDVKVVLQFEPLAQQLNDLVLLALLMRFSLAADERNNLFDRICCMQSWPTARAFTR